MEMLDRWAEDAGSAYYGWLQNDTDLEAVRDHPRYPALLANIKAVAEARVDRSTAVPTS